MNLMDIPVVPAPLMPLTLKDYVKVYEGVFEKDFCNRVVDVISQGEWLKHNFYNVRADQSYSHEDDLDVSYDRCKEKTELQSQLWYVIDRYIRKDNSFMAGWFGAWNGYSEVRFNRYNVGTQMHVHCDHIHSMFDGTRKGVPTLTILGALNDDYEGGELIMWEQERIHLPAGSVAIFPSNFLYPHRVAPVTKGVRHSYVSWVW